MFIMHQSVSLPGQQMKLSILVPAYNEAATIKTLLEKVKAVPLDTQGVQKEILVIDDGSKDGTRDIVEDISGVKLIKHRRNKGKGGAVKTGIRAATGDIIIIQDADLEYDPREYYRCIRPIIDGKTKVVYGSRFLALRQKRRNILFIKKHKKSYLMAYLGGRLISWATNMLFGGNLTDEPTCYKCFDAKTIKRIHIKGNKFDWEPEVTAKLLKQGHTILEVPISYYPRTFEQGKKINWKDGVQAVWTLLKYRFIN